MAAAVVLLGLQAVEFAPTKNPKWFRISKRGLLLPRAPVPDEMDGVHLPNNNDVDTGTTKRPYILLSKPKGCASMGEGKKKKGSFWNTFSLGKRPEGPFKSGM